MIITIIGGGSTFTAGIVKSIALRKDELEVDEIRLFDLDRDRQEKVAVVVRWILDEELKCGIKLTTHYDEESAYKDADFIFAQNLIEVHVGALGEGRIIAQCAHLFPQGFPVAPQVAGIFRNSMGHTGVAQLRVGDMALAA